MKNNKNILLLGSTGFVGSRLKKVFIENEYNIFIKKNRITHIINCAGKVGGILDNSLNQIDYFRENNEINYNLISSSYEENVKNFLNLSSSCMYPNNFNTMNTY